MHSFMLLTSALIISSAAAQAAGGWNLKTSVSPIDDSRTVTLSLPAEGAIKGWLAAARPVLILRCLEGKMAAVIATGVPAQVETPTYQVTVTYRYGQDEAVTVAASKGSDGKAIFLPNPEHHVGLMLEHERVVYRFTPFNAVPQTMSFDVRGLRKVAGPLLDTCGLDATPLP
jgi:hypothetical protein